MSEITNVKAIVLESKNYKEKDKLLTLFTLEQGVIFAIIKSVKNMNAKLSMAKEIFCFGDFTLTQKGQFNIVTSVNVLETFFDITKDFDRYNLGCQVLNINKTICNQNESNKLLFIETLKCLKHLTYDNSINPKYIFLKFLIKIFNLSGYSFNYEKCNSCGGHFINKYFDYTRGEIVCNHCKTMNCVEVDNATLSAIKILGSYEYEKLSNIKLAKDSENKALKILCNNFENKFDRKIIIN